MSEFVVRGGATAEEVAAVAALLAARVRTGRPEDAYERWRRTRVAAMRTEPAGGAPHP